MSLASPPWHLGAIGRPPGSPAGTAALSGRGATVAVLDTGIDATHPDLAGRVLAAYQVEQGGLTPLDPGADHDFHGHGTQVAGLMCAGAPGLGVAPNAKLISMVFPRHGTNYARIYLALRELVEKVEGGKLAIRLMNLSSGVVLSDPGRRLVLQDFLRRLLAADVLPIVAIGNQSQPGEPPFCPADLPEAVAVGATNASGAVCHFSRSGPCGNSPDPGRSKPDLVAPGEALLTCRRGGGHLPRTGTSFATAIVSGVAALFIEQQKRTAAELRDVLLGNCVPVPGPPERQGAGLVRAP
jgi:subtilisin family serine protease